MKYDFDKLCDRKNTCSVKHDFCIENGKSSDIMPFWIADMDIPTCGEIVRAMKERAEHGIFGYTMPKEEYFNAVAEWFNKRHGWHADPEKFICTPGVVFAINTLIRALSAESDAVIICQPVYYPFESSVKRNNRKLVVSRLKEDNGYYTVDFDDFERKIVENNVKIFILCSPHNPVGRVWNKEELLRLGEICLRNNVFVIADEIHCDFVYAGNRHITFPEADKRFAATCAVCTSPSKSFNLAGLQISNIYIPDGGVRKKFEAELDKIGYWEPNIMGMTACLAAYSKGGEWFDCLKEYLWENIEFVKTYLAENIPGIKFYTPQGTYLLWLDCRALGLDDKSLVELFEQKAGLWMDDGYIFGLGGNGFERLNVACPRSVLKTALDKLKNAVAQL